MYQTHTDTPSADDRAIMAWELSEARKDLASLRTRIRFQVQIGCAEGAERLRREYARVARRCRSRIDALSSVAIAE